MKILAWAVATVVLVLSVSIAAAQSPKEAQRPREQKPATTNPNTVPTEPAQDDIETLKIDTNLVTVPVIASSQTGKYISDLRKFRSHYPKWKITRDLDTIFKEIIAAQHAAVLSGVAR